MDLAGKSRTQREEGRGRRRKDISVHFLLLFPPPSRQEPVLTLCFMRILGHPGKLFPVFASCPDFCFSPNCPVKIANKVKVRISMKEVKKPQKTQMLEFGEVGKTKRYVSNYPADFDLLKGKNLPEFFFL